MTIATLAPADADMQAVLNALTALHGKPIETLDATEARKQPGPTDAMMVIIRKHGRDPDQAALVIGVTSVNRTIPGPASELPIRIYTPAGTGPFPVVVYYHGGGWAIANLDAYDGGARGLAKQANAIVVSVDYRLAPEARFPAQHDDALATYQWVIANAASFNGDPARLAIAGESAGGNLAVATAIAARDLGIATPLHVVAVYPIAQIANMATPSYEEHEHAKPLNKAMMAWFVEQVVHSPVDAADHRLDLVGAKLAGLPPVTIVNASIDPLKSDGDMLAEALKAAGVRVQHRVYEGVTHEFFGMSYVVEKAKQAQAFAGYELKKSLGSIMAA